MEVNLQDATDAFWFIKPVHIGVVTFGIGLSLILLYSVLAFGACGMDIYLPGVKGKRTFGDLVKTFLLTIALLGVTTLAHEASHVIAVLLSQGTVLSITYTSIFTDVTWNAPIQHHAFIARSGPGVQLLIAIACILWPKRNMRSLRMAGIVIVLLAVLHLSPVTVDGQVAQHAAEQLGMSP